MARPQKTGLDYFPHDTDASTDEKIEALEAIFGAIGYAFYFKALERIFKAAGFWRINSPETRLIFGINRMKWSRDEVETKWNALVDACLRLQLFDEEAYSADRKSVV